MEASWQMGSTTSCSRCGVPRHPAATSVLAARESISAEGGSLAVELDFGSSVFVGDARWLAIAMHPGLSNDSYKALYSLQRIGPTPHSVCPLSSDTIDGKHASDFMTGGTDNWVHTGRNTVTGYSKDRPICTHHDLPPPPLYPRYRWVGACCDNLTSSQSRFRYCSNDSERDAIQARVLVIE